MNSGLLAALLLPVSAFATSMPAWSADPAHAIHRATDKTAPADRETMWKNALARAPLAMTAAFDGAGQLWLASVKEGRIYLRPSADKGKHFGDAVAVNTEPEFIAADGENRPKIAFGPEGQIYVSWTQSLPSPFSGHVRFARSRDGGRTFSVPLTVNDNLDPIGHRFESMIVNRRGEIFLAWLDKREAATASQNGGKFTGLSVYYSLSADDGVSFRHNHKAADHSCECCRVALALDSDDTPVIFWRHVFGKNTRDHALLRLDGKSKIVRASHDGWEVDACPHHGPALSIGADGVYHLAWFTGAAGHAGLYYSRTTDRGGHFSPPMKFGNSEAQAAHPQVLARHDRVWLAWKEFDGRLSTVRAMVSKDGGASWSEPLTVASTTDASDYPLLIADGTRAYISWHAIKEGYRLLELGGEKS